jgi:DNA repair protein RecO (recombination protein O)
MNLIKTRGVVLRAINLREADRILEIYSEDLGKVRAVARGLRKIQSKLAGHLEPFTYVELMFARGRGDLPTITGAKAIEHFPAMRRDLKRVAAATYIAELVSRLTPDGQVSGRFPELLLGALRALDTDHSPNHVVAYYEWLAVMVAGWEPELHHCVSCHQKLYPQGMVFSVAMGGVLCKNCATADPEAVRVSPESVKLLRCYAERPFSEVEGMLVGKKVAKKTKELADHVVRQTLDREPKSRAFLKHLEMV